MKKVSILDVTAIRTFTFNINIGCPCLWPLNAEQKNLALFLQQYSISRKFLRKAWYTHVLLLSRCDTRKIRTLCSPSTTNSFWVHLVFLNPHCQMMQEKSQEGMDAVPIMEQLPRAFSLQQFGHTCTHPTNYDTGNTCGSWWSKLHVEYWADFLPSW